MPWKPWGRAAGLLLLVLVAYLPTLGAGFLWDDDSYVTDNATLRSAAGLRAIWARPLATPQYYPLVFTTFWAEYHLWELDPTGYHLVNVLVHGLNAVLLWRVLLRLGLPGAWFAAALFALHPVHVESVAWITERKNVLSGLFYLSALLAYWRFSQGPPGDREGEAVRPRSAGDRAWYGLALACYLCALWSKTVTCSLPAALVLLLWWKRGGVSRRDAIALAPMFALGVAMGLTTAWLEKHHVGATGPEWALTPAQRCLIAGRALWFYAGKLLFPVDLAFVYPRWRVDPGAWWQWLYPAGAAAVIGALWAARGRIGRGPLVAALLFAGTLVPSLGFFNVYPMRFSFVADHFQYLASAALLAPAGVLAARVSRAWAPGLPWAGPAVGGAILAVLGVLTFGRALVFNNQVSLWEDAIRKNPDAYLAHNNLGKILLDRGEMEPARRHFAEALRIYPDYIEANNNLGLILAQQGRLAEAERHLTLALGLNPDYWLARYNLGIVRRKQKRRSEALREFEAALQLHPGYAAAHAQIGMTLAEQGRAAAAFDRLGRAARLAEATPLDAYSSSVFDDAAWILATAPDAGLRNGPLALRLARLACGATGYGRASSLNSLAAALAEVGRFDEALARARQALALTDKPPQPRLAGLIRRAIGMYEGRRPYRQ